MAHRVSANRYAIQNEMVDYILAEILSLLRRGSSDAVEELLEFLDDLNITNEMIKEHLFSLCLNSKIKDQFTNISSGTKASFTRKYNKSH